MLAQTEPSLGFLTEMLKQAPIAAAIFAGWMINARICTVNTNKLLIAILGVTETALSMDDKAKAAAVLEKTREKLLEK